MSLPITSEALLDQLTTAAMVVSPMVSNENFKILYANPALARLLETDVQSLVGQSANQWFRGSEKNLSACLGDMQSGFCITATHAETRVRFKPSTLSTGNILLLIDRFSEDAALIQSHTDFINTVSHEFRTPLTSIKGFADTLLNYGTQLDTNQQKRFLAIIKDQADRLIRLVENVLTVSRLGAGKMPLSFRPIGLQKLVQKVTQTLQGKYGGKPYFNIHIDPHLPPVWADADRLEQILTNIIDNAVKYSDTPDASVQITARLTPGNTSSHDELIEIQVVDQGIGIPSKYQSKLFTQFYRVENPLTQKVEGTGLGLYITQAMTAALGGQIRLESPVQDQRGTRVILTFPVATAERQAMHRKKLMPTES